MATSFAVTPDHLRRVTILADLPEEDLLWIGERCEGLAFDPGERTFEPGAAADYMAFQIAGELRIHDRAGMVTLVTHGGDTIAKLPHSRMKNFPNVRTEASDGLTLAKFFQRDFDALLTRLPVVEERLVGIMADRIRETTRTSLQQDKLVALGTMSAGLAHELNNPASAAERTAKHLVATLEKFNCLATRLLKRLMFKELEGTGEYPFQPLVDRMALDGVELDPLEQSEREDALGVWLEECGHEEPWHAAATLVGVGFTREWLEEFAQQLEEYCVCDFLGWLALDVEMRQLARHLTESTSRISGLVRAMKDYSYMDQAITKTDTDLEKGLRDTITILAHKLRKKAIEVRKDFAEMPPVPAIGGQLNQVWTNLLDNAIHACPEEGGVIQVRTRRNGGTVIVEIEDNGSGIPAEVKPRIFEPFFTTKPVGQGTGLGLDASRRIVVKGHGGDLNFESRPGRTCFQVRLPAG
ncbi:MAG: ATP-binding protein [Sumerlaeia bacterium]